MGKFIVTKRTNGEYQFNLTAGNTLNILSSEGYSSKAGCMNGVDSVKRHAGEESNYEIRTASNGKVYFVLKAANAQIIGTSQMYADNGSCMAGISSVMNNASGATIEDQSGG